MSKRLTPSELESRLASDRPVTVIDVRKQSSYDEGHVPGALHIPVDDLTKHLSELPKEHLLVTY